MSEEPLGALCAWRSGGLQAWLGAGLVFGVCASEVALEIEPDM